jgi:hypothetical protein
VRLVDTILRQGHLSDQALAEVYMTGERPAHLDRCEVCVGRAVELGRWLDDVRTVGLEEADAAFPPERLAAQQGQILRRLEQIDRPARVIAFPGQSRYGQLEGAGHGGIRPAWVGFAAAAGLVLGLVGGQFSARLTKPTVIVTTLPAIQTSQAEQAVAYEAPSASLQDLDENDRVRIPSVDALDQSTPHAREVSLQQVVPHTGRVIR